MHIPVIKRLKEMFEADNTQVCKPLEEQFFARVVDIVENQTDINWEITSKYAQAKEFIDECYAYITITRVKLEYKVLYKDSASSKQSLRQGDDFYLNRIVEYRDFIFGDL